MERIGNGNTLIAYYGWPSSYFIREVDPEGNTIWEKSWSYQISDAKRLQNGNTLIAEPGNNRIVEINSLGIIVWQMDGFYLPNDVERLWDIQNRPPTADAGGPYGAINGTELRLDASRSVDPDWDELQYRWDFDNDGNWDTGYATEPTVSHLYYDYVGLVKVEVDDGEYKSTDTAKVTMGSYGKILITEFWGQRVLEVDVNGNSNVVWENTIPSTQKPRDIEILDNGNILLTEGNTYSTGGFDTELDNYNNIVWQMTH